MPEGPLDCPVCGHTLDIGAQRADEAPRHDRSPPVFAAHTPVDSHESETPQQIARFLIQSRLGAGAFGTVYQAYDPQLERQVALKVPNPGVLDSPNRITRFLREAKSAANLRHPHIVPVYDAGCHDNQYFIASAFIAGQPLANRVEDHGNDFRQAAIWVKQLAEALAYAHEQGIVHRDIKPANCMVDEDGRRIISGSTKTLKIWDPETGQEFRTLAGPSGTVMSIAISSDGRWIVSGGNEDNALKVWDAGNTIVNRIPTGNFQPKSIALSQDARQLFAWNSAGEVATWELATLGSLEPVNPPPRTVSTSVITPDGKFHILLLEGVIQMIDLEKNRWPLPETAG